MSPRRPAEYVPMNDLAKLIHRRKEELGLSWYEIAERGSFSSHTVVYTLAKKKVHRQPPRAETLTRLARALEIDEDIVRAAAASAAGYRVQDGVTSIAAADDVRAVVNAMQEMTDEDRGRVRKIALSFLPDNFTLDTAGERGQGTPIAPEPEQFLQDLSEAAKKVPGPANVRSISAKRSPRKKS